jgi:putative ABC transport system substrate-binding protein
MSASSRRLSGQRRPRGPARCSWLPAQPSIRTPGESRELAAKNRLPAMYHFRYYVEAGGLVSYAPDLIEIWRGAAAFVDKILKGAKPADLPVEQPTKFELVINLKTARTLGLTIPQSILQRADQVIE